MAANRTIVGKVNKMKCGQNAIVIRDFGADDIDVRFEDGTIVRHTRRSQFRSGCIKHPNIAQNEYRRKDNEKFSILGQYKVMTCGLGCKVIVDNGADDISVEFDNGEIREHIKRKRFRCGNILPPSQIKKKPSYLGYEKKMNCGYTCKVIKDLGCSRITVQFEDGSISENRLKQEFDNGTIVCPTLKEDKNLGNLLGISKKMNCGLVATVIRDGGNKDIDIEFENGVILEHKLRSEFRAGRLTCLGKENYEYNKKKSMLGQTLVMNNGMTATVISDRGFNDIDIQFEDGFKVEHISRVQFRKGNIGNKKNILKNKYIGRKKRMSNGLICEIVDYIDSDNVIMKFEDGTEVVSKINNFNNGHVKNPNLSFRSILGTEKKMYNGMFAKVIEDNSADNIVVEFEDGFQKHTTRAQFYSGFIRNDNLDINNSRPERFVTDALKTYCEDLVTNIRPDWLRSSITSRCFELDAYIPSLRLAIEYDGVAFHSEKTQSSEEKFKQICSCEYIEKIITILEDGAVEHISDKHINYKLSCDSSQRNYIILYQELEDILADIINNYLSLDGDFYETE